MVRQTSYHGWDVMESGDTDYYNTFRQLIEQIDKDVILRGTPGMRPPAGRKGRVYVEYYPNDDESQPILYFDDGDAWRPAASYIEIPPEVVRRDRSEIIQEKWTFTEPIETDIDGKAAEAETADYADTAGNTDQLGERDADEYLRRDEKQEISEQHTFEQGITVEGALKAEGVIQLPRFEQTPPTHMRGRGSLWWRDDAQPR